MLEESDLLERGQRFDAAKARRGKSPAQYEDVDE
jgi:hypothetical protein